MCLSFHQLLRHMHCPVPTQQSRFLGCQKYFFFRQDFLLLGTKWSGWPNWLTFISTGLSLSMPEYPKDRTEGCHLSTIAGTTPQWLVNSEGKGTFSWTRSLVYPPSCKFVVDLFNDLKVPKDLDYISSRN